MRKSHMLWQQLFLLLVQDRQVHYSLHRFADNHSITASQCDVSIRQLFDVANQVGIQDDRRTVKFGQANQTWNP